MDEEQVRRETADAIRERMEELGLSVAELERRSGLSRTTIYAVLGGEPRRKHDRTNLALCKALEWHPDSFENIAQGSVPVTLLDALDEALVRVQRAEERVRTDHGGYPDWGQPESVDDLEVAHEELAEALEAARDAGLAVRVVPVRDRQSKPLKDRGVTFSDLKARSESDRDRLFNDYRLAQEMFHERHGRKVDYVSRREVDDRIEIEAGDGQDRLHYVVHQDGRTLLRHERGGRTDEDWDAWATGITSPSSSDGGEDEEL